MADGSTPFNARLKQVIARRWPGLVRLKHAVLGQASAVNEVETAALARDVALALRKGRRPRPRQLSLYQHMSLLRTLIDTETIALCKSYVASADLPLGRFSSFDLLVAMLRAAPDSRDGDTGDLPRRNDDAGFLALRKAGSARVLFIFTGVARQFGCPLPVVHQWFRGLDASLVYLFDLAGTYYLGGVPGLSGTLDGTIDRLSGLMQDMGASEACCIGNSGGGFGALYYAPLLGAKRVLAFSPPTVIRESLAAVCDRAPDVRRLVSGDGTISIGQLYREMGKLPASRVYYPAENAHDQAEAAALEGLAGGDVRPVQAVKDHNLVPLLVSRNAFNDELVWLTAS